MNKTLLDEVARQDDGHTALIMSMPGPQGTLMRLLLAWPTDNLGAWMAGEANRKTPPQDTAAALANLMSGVIDAFAVNTSDRKNAIFGGMGVFTMIEASLKARIAKEAAATKKGLILPGLGGPH